MAKKEIIETPVEEVVEEIVEEVVEEVVEVKPEKKPMKKTVDVDAFINRKLKVINEMTNKAQAKVLAERVISNRKEN